GTVDIDFETEPLGYDPQGEPVYLRDIWPSQEEIRETIERSLDASLFEQQYAEIFQGDERWERLPVPEGDLYEWDPKSTYIQEPPFFKGMPKEPGSIQEIRGARILAVLGDNVTTDHISPAGAIAKDGPAGRYLREQGVEPVDFNTYGSRRRNHEVMMRGTLANIRIRNEMVPGLERCYTIHFPSGEQLPIYDAAMRYKEEGVPLVVIAGKEYGTGSSRDWAAKGTYLLGVKAVIAESFERIHRSNLVGMGVLPLVFRPGENRKTLGLSGSERIDILGLSDQLVPNQEVTVRAVREDGSAVEFQAIVRLHSPVEVDYFRKGWILQSVLRKLLASARV